MERRETFRKLRMRENFSKVRSTYFKLCHISSSWNFNDSLFRLLRATSSGSAKQVFSTFHSLDQRIPMDYIGFLWTLLDSAVPLIGAYPLILYSTDSPLYAFVLFSTFHLFCYPVWLKNLTKKCGKLSVFNRLLF